MSRRRDMFIADCAVLTPPAPIELEILELIAEGTPDAEIAAKFATSLDAIKQRIHRMFGHLKANNRAHAVAIAMRAGWIR